MKDGRISNPAQTCSAVTVYTERGEKLIFADNGCLSFTVLCDRGMDIYSLRHKGTNISFLSKNGLNGFNGEFESRFEGGLLYTCGLDTVGGRKPPVHGKIHNIPARITGVTADETGICISGYARQSGLFGENLVLYRTIKTDYASGLLKIENEIVNEGFTDAEYCLLFHTNFGYPFLDDGAEIIADVTSTVPRTKHAEEGLSDCFKITAPRAGEEERVYFHKVKTGNISIVNKSLAKRVQVKYNSDALPHFIEWKSMASGDYALGIEPSTTTLDGDFKTKTIKAGGRDGYPLEILIEEI